MSKLERNAAIKAIRNAAAWIKGSGPDYDALIEDEAETAAADERHPDDLAIVARLVDRLDMAVRVLEQADDVTDEELERGGAAVSQETADRVERSIFAERANVDTAHAAAKALLRQSVDLCRIIGRLQSEQARAMDECNAALKSEEAAENVGNAAVVRQLYLADVEQAGRKIEAAWAAYISTN